jgi:hypothetical protein
MGLPLAHWPSPDCRGVRPLLCHYSHPPPLTDDDSYEPVVAKPVLVTKLEEEEEEQTQAKKPAAVRACEKVKQRLRCCLLYPLAPRRLLHPRLPAGALHLHPRAEVGAQKGG